MRGVALGLLLPISALMSFSLSLAEDWPTYMHDIARSGVTSEELRPPLYEQWVFVPTQPPCPAWPPPKPAPVEGVLEPHRLDFDYAFHVVSAKGRVYFGSSANNKVYCLDARSGKVVWTFFTGGPVRLAPTVWDGRVYVGSDDGFVYCLRAEDGRLLWKFRAAPHGDKVLGNGRMISLWPVRTGVLVDKGIAYFGAGVFPYEGVYLYALRARDGKLIWKNDSWGFFRSGWGSRSPQGYLLADEKRLYVPTGRTPPACFDRETGRLIYHREGTMAPGWQGRYHYLFGGCYALIAGEHLYSGGREVVALNRRTGKTGFAWFSGRKLIVTVDVSYLLTGKELIALDRSTYIEASRRRFSLVEEKIRLTERVNRAKGREREELKRQLEEVNRKLKEVEEFMAEKAVKWKLPCELSSSMIKSGDVLFVGGKGAVIAVDAVTGKELWRCEVEGEARGLAVANGRLYVSTDKGNIYCFARKKVSSPTRVVERAEPEPYPRDELTPVFEEVAERILEETGIRRGYCLVLGCGSGRLAYELAKRSELIIYGIELDVEKVKRAREALDRAGIYGTRVTVEAGPLSELPYPDYFANLIVSEEALVSGRPVGKASELFRVLKPCGGMIYIGQTEEAAELTGKKLTAEELRRWIAEAGIERFQIAEEDGVWLEVRRGPLPGAGGWTHQYANPANTASSDDQLVRCPLGILWFGDPGPAKMLSRHAAAAAPLSLNGRFFVEGDNVIMAYDAYNGLKLWEREMEGARCPGVNRRGSNIACSDDGLFVAVGEKCLLLDAETGRTLKEFSTPPSPDGKPRPWGYVAVVDKTLFGSCSIGTGRSDALFAVDVASGKLKWVHRGGEIEHNAIAIGNGRVFFADRAVTEEERARAAREGGGKDVRKVIALDAESGEVIWSRVVDLTDCGPPLHLIYCDGLLIFCGAFQNGHFWGHFYRGELAHRRITVLSAEDGRLIWSKPCNYFTRPLVIGGIIYADPWAYDLRTGEKVKHIHPITGEEVPFELGRGHHCGPLSGSPHCLFMRSLTTAFYDLERDWGVIHFGGHRPGCHINMIAANGLLIVPEASCGCVCGFSLYSTVVLKPREREKGWGRFCSTAPSIPVRHLAVNLGAPGDRRDADGTLWLSYPRPSIPLGLRLDLKIELMPGMGYFMTNPEDVEIKGTDKPWLFSFGCCGLTKCVIPVSKGERGLYTVRLGFIEFEGAKPGQRVFDIRIQGRTVAKGFEILREAGEPNVAVIKEFRGIEAGDTLTIELIPAEETDDPRKAPILCAIEVIRED